MTKMVMAAIVAASFFPVAASAVTIDFEGLDNGALVNSISSADGSISATVSTIENGRNPTNQAIIFDTTEGGTLDRDLEDPFRAADDRNNILRPGNILIIQESGSSASNPDDSARGGVISFAFDQLVSFTGFTILDDAIISVSATINGVANNVGTFEVTNDRGFGIFSFDPFDGVSALSFNFIGDGSGRNQSGGIDSLTFNAGPTGGVSPVPVPAALPLLLAAMGGLGVMSRRRKKQA